ncbi:hypothetical protein FS837_004349 [Tulasnella sp. UAMH 9824]|nr:hypothetical protein FS837_004349 [Tulasnella sp. UAMH 9824]
MAIQGSSFQRFTQEYGEEKKKKYHVDHPKLWFFDPLPTRMKKLGTYILVIKDILDSESRLLKPASRRDAERLVLEYKALVGNCGSQKSNKLWTYRAMLKSIDHLQTDLKSNYKIFLASNVENLAGEITDSNDPVFKAEVQQAFSEYVDEMSKEIDRAEGQAQTILRHVQDEIDDIQPCIADTGVRPVSVKAVEGKEDFVVLHDLRDTIHQGGFGLVYKVKRQDDQSKIYAMKVVNGGPEAWTDLEREKQLWMQLDHKNILPFEGTVFIDENGRGLGLLSPFIIHRDLAIMIRKKEYKEPQRVSFLRQISDAIVYLHAFPFIHGDIKPENILIDGKHKALLCDFGLSKDATFKNTEPRHIGAGSEGFVAPDQTPNPVDGSHEPKDERSDMFAFGKTMAEVIANLRFRGDPPPEFPEAVKTEAALKIWDLARLCLSPIANSRPSASEVSSRLHTIEGTYLE